MKQIIKDFLSFLLLLISCLSAFVLFHFREQAAMFGILPWIIPQLLFYFALRLFFVNERKTVSLLSTFIIMFTFSIPVVERLILKDLLFQNNQQIHLLFDRNNTFYQVYLLLLGLMAAVLLLNIFDFIFYGNKKFNKAKNLEYNQNFINDDEIEALADQSYKSASDNEFDSVPKQALEDESVSLHYERQKHENHNDTFDPDTFFDTYKEKYEPKKKDSFKNHVDIKSKINYVENTGKIDTKKYSDHIIKNATKNTLKVPVNNKANSEDIEIKSSIITKTLKDFGIESRIINHHVGPVITRFEIQVDDKVNLSKVLKVEKNITYNLSAEKIRILAPIPGKKAIGIEIPNQNREIVSFHSCINSETYEKCTDTLPIILGKDIDGEIIIADLAKMPHLLVAGRTGSGKSVCINTIIASLIVRLTPDMLRFILIDPKRVELALFEPLPHLLTDEIVIYPDDASAALKWLVLEMERRYNTLKDQGCRSIEQYNNQISQPLPYLVLIIDEFYALMQTSQKLIEDSLIRLSAMSRAVGIHLIFATQRPSAEVVTGVIKSNLPSRIAFQTFSKSDSRIILDSNGAEALLGNGDLLLSFAGLPPVRIQGAFITTEEVKKIVQTISSTYSAEKINIFDEIRRNDPENTSEFEDPLYTDAIEIVRNEKKISASYLQRRLKIGYNRAARIVEQMEKDGYIGPFVENKKRDIYLD